MKTITYEGTNFNADHLAKKTEEEFIKEFENTPVYKDYSPADRIKLLKEAYAKCKEAAGVVDQPVSAPAAGIESTANEKPPKKGTDK